MILNFHFDYLTTRLNVFAWSLVKKIPTNVFRFFHIHISCSSSYSLYEKKAGWIGGFSRLMRLFAFLCSIYFKSMCLITIPLLDAVTFDALSWSQGCRRNIWTSSFVSSSTIVSRFGLSVVGLCSSGHFPAMTSDCLSLNIFIRDQKRFSQSHWICICHLKELRVLLHATFDDA